MYREELERCTREVVSVYPLTSNQNRMDATTSSKRPESHSQTIELFIIVAVTTNHQPLSYAVLDTVK